MNFGVKPIVEVEQCKKLNEGHSWYCGLKSYEENGFAVSSKFNHRMRLLLNIMLSL